MKQISYKAGYKYQLVADYVAQLPSELFAGSRLGNTVRAGHYLTLCYRRELHIDRGYAWDGPSGPTVDTPSFMRASLVHDALYQMIRYEAIPATVRPAVDKLLLEICIQDGMHPFRARAAYKALEWFGASAADPKNRKEVRKAP